MSVKRFVAADMRRALELVKQEMGPDAIILSSNRIKEGVEIVTSDDTNHQAVSESASFSQLFSDSQPQSNSQQTIDTSFQPKNLSTSDEATESRSLLGKFRKKKISTDQIESKSGCSAFEYYSDKANSTLNNNDIPEKLNNCEIEREFVAPLHLASMQYEPGSTSINFSFDKKNFLKEPVTTEDKAGFSVEDEANEFEEVDEFLDEQFSQLRSEILEMQELLRQQFSVKTSITADLEALNAEPNPQHITQKKSLLTLKEPMERSKVTHELSKVAFLNIEAPLVKTITKRLNNLGLPNAEIKKCLSRISTDEQELELDKVWTNILADIAHRLTPFNEQEKINSKNVSVFAGLSGSGKTDVIGKFATQHVVNNGSEDIIIISIEKNGLNTKKERKIERLSHILSVQHYTVDNVEDVIRIISHAKSVSKVLVSLESMSVNVNAGNTSSSDISDNLKMINQLHNALSNSFSKPQQFNFKSHLIISADSSQSSIDSLFNIKEERIKNSPEAPLIRKSISSCILTKVDQLKVTADSKPNNSFGRLLGSLLAVGLPVSYVTHGANLPQYLQPAKGFQLVTTSVKLMKKSIQFKNSKTKKHIKLGNLNKLPVNKSTKKSIKESFLGDDFRVNNPNYSHSALETAALKQVALP